MKKLLLIALVYSHFIYASYGVRALSDVTVATAGTKVQLSSTTLFVSSFCIQGKSTNSGLVYVADSSVSSTKGAAAAAGQSVCLEPSPNLDSIDLSTIYLDASANSSVAKVIYTYYIPNN